MRKDINLTICLRFLYESERALVMEDGKTKRKQHEAEVAQAFINAMILTHKKNLPVVIPMEFAGKKYTVAITADETV